MDLSIYKIRSKFQNVNENILDKFHTQNLCNLYVPLCDALRKFNKKDNSIQFQFLHLFTVIFFHIQQILQLHSLQTHSAGIVILMMPES